MALKVEVRRVFEENFRVYGVRKAWRQLQREGFELAAPAGLLKMSDAIFLCREPLEIAARRGAKSENRRKPRCCRYRATGFDSMPAHAESSSGESANRPAS